MMSKTRSIGNSGIQVHPIGLGGMPMSIEGRPSEEQAVRVICSALDSGINLIDTADSYCLDERDLGHNERLIARALREWKGTSRVLVATKGGVTRPGGEWVHDGRPEYLKRACKASLESLARDRIELYQFHAPDSEVPFEDSVGALAELQRAGLIEHIGLSNVTVAQIRAATQIAPIVSVQNEASPYHPQGLTDGVLKLCQAEGISFIAYSPLGGWRAGKIAHEPVLQSIGERLQVTPFQVVLAWLLSKSPNLLPIAGASREKSARDSAAAAEVDLTESDILRLDAEFMRDC